MPCKTHLFAHIGHRERYLELISVRRAQIVEDLLIRDGHAQPPRGHGDRILQACLLCAVDYEPPCSLLAKKLAREVGVARLASDDFCTRTQYVKSA